MKTCGLRMDVQGCGCFIGNTCGDEAWRRAVGDAASERHRICIVNIMDGNNEYA